MTCCMTPLNRFCIESCCTMALTFVARPLTCTTNINCRRRKLVEVHVRMCTSLSSPILGFVTASSTGMDKHPTQHDSDKDEATHLINFWQFPCAVAWKTSPTLAGLLGCSQGLSRTHRVDLHQQNQVRPSESQLRFPDNSASQQLPQQIQQLWQHEVAGLLVRSEVGPM